MKKQVLLLVAILSLCTLLGFSKTVYAGNSPEGIADLVDREVSRLVQENSIKGGVVSIVKDDQVVLSKGYGFADEDKGIMADGATTAFRIGSISKTFVAVAAMQLVEQGKLKMDAPISTYLDSNFPKFQHSITMKDLLTHTAGFEDMISGMIVGEAEKAEPLSKSVRNYIPDQVFKPGEVVSYSNYGIALAAYIIESITQKSFDDYAEEVIFTPLKMQDTTFKLNRLIHPYVAKGYGSNGTERVEPFINIYPEGSVTSTADDMSKYMIFLLNHSSTILGDKQKSEIFRQHFTMDPKFQGIGYTWNRYSRNGSLYYDKKGETINFYSRIIIYPEQKTGVFISFNTPPPKRSIEGISNKVTEHLLGSEKEQEFYNGMALNDISGYYVSTWSSFNQPEKFLNLVIPERTIHITGSIEEGFQLDGEAFIPMGKDYYRSKLGLVKFIEKEGKAYLSSNTSSSYLRTSWYEYRGWQMLVVVFFIGFSSVGFIVSSIYLILSLKKRRSQNALVTLPGIVMFPLFALLCSLTLSSIGVDTMRLMTHLKVLSGTMASVGFLGILATIYFWRQKKTRFIRFFYTGWSIAIILFVLWLALVNLV